MEARIPFGGFYNSMWSDGIDEEERQHAEYLAEKYAVDADDVVELLIRHTEYRDAYREVACEYVPHFETHLNRELGLSIKLTYKEMTSPREYNFETDKVWVEISYPDAIRLARKIGRNALRKAAKEMFTSRSGFYSFYANDPSKWGRLRGWDHNQMYCLLTAAVDFIGEESYDWSIYETMSGNGRFGEAFHGAVNHTAVDLGIDQLVSEQETDEELAEVEDDGRKFPTEWSSTPDYIERYYALNANAIGLKGRL